MPLLVKDNCGRASCSHAVNNAHLEAVAVAPCRRHRPRLVLHLCLLRVQSIKGHFHAGAQCACGPLESMSCSDQAWHMLAVCHQANTARIESVQRLSRLSFVAWQDVHHPLHVRSDGSLCPEECCSRVDYDTEEACRMLVCRSVLRSIAKLSRDSGRWKSGKHHAPPVCNTEKGDFQWGFLSGFRLLFKRAETHWRH